MCEVQFNSVPTQGACAHAQAVFKLADLADLATATAVVKDVA